MGVMSNISRAHRTVLFVNDLMDKALGGGIEHTIHTLTTVLTEAGHRCITLSMSGDKRLSRHEREGVVHWVAPATAGLWAWRGEWMRRRPSLPARQLMHALSTYNPFIQKYLRHVIAVESPDVISMHNISHWSVASWRTASRAGVPVVQVLHGHSAICFFGTMRKGDENCVAQCRGCRFRRISTPLLENHLTAVVGVSNYILNRHVDLGFFSHVPIRRVIHNGRDPRTMAPPSNARSARRDGVRFGYIGRIHSAKGIDRLIDAFAAAGVPDAELRIAGTGPDELVQALKARANGLKVSWLGHVNAAEFYAQVDVIVVPSVCNETFSGVVYEAQALGKAVVASARGGTPEMIEHGRSGLLFEPDNPQELVDALRALAGSEALRARLALGGTEASRPLVDRARLASDYEDLYDDVLARHASGAR